MAAITPHPLVHERREQDPTALTTMQLHRELEGLKELLISRLDGMDKASILLSENMTRVPTNVDKQVLNLQRLHNERFAAIIERFTGIQRQFDERDVRTDNDKMAQKEAASLLSNAALVGTAAALQAQKEMAAAQNASNTSMAEEIKSNTAEKINGVGAMLASLGTVTTDKFDTFNGRLNRIEGASQGHSSTVTNVIAISALLIAVLVGTVTIVVAVPHPAPAQTQTQAR